MILLSRLVACFFVFFIVRGVTSGMGTGISVLALLIALVATWIGVGRLLRRQPPATDYRRGGPSQVDTPTTGTTYGIAGESISRGAEAFGQENSDAGVAGEIATGQLLNAAQHKMPYLTVFHSLEWPGSRTSDIDHAVLARTRNGRDVLTIIDSKMWKSGAYRWDGVTPMRDGQSMHPIYFSSGNPQYNLPSASESLRRRVPGVEIRSVIVMHNATSVQNVGNPSCPMVTSRELQGYLKSIYSGGSVSTNTGVINRLVNMLK